MNLTKRTELRRIPGRGSHDWETINQILDAGFLASVGFCVDGQPFVIPTLYGRDAFDHSMNYRSVVAFGTARKIAGNASSHARIVPMLLRLVPRLQSAFPGGKIKLRGDAGFAFPLLYQLCEFFQIEYAIGIPANCVFQQRAQPRQKQLKRRYCHTQVPQRSFSSFRHRALSWSRQRRICYKAEHSAAGTNLRFVVTNGSGRASQVFAFYNDRGECENRIEEFKNGFCADRLSCHRFLANAFRLLLHAAAYNLVNFFRHQLPQPWRSAQIETLRAQLFKIGARVRQTARCIRVHLATGWPFQALFHNALAFNPG